MGKVKNSIAVNVRQPAGSLVGIRCSFERGELTLELERIPAAEGVGYIEPPKTLILGSKRRTRQRVSKKGPQ